MKWLARFSVYIPGHLIYFFFIFPPKKKICLKAIRKYVKIFYCESETKILIVSQVPFLMVVVIKRNRFTAATVRQDTFSWSIEWNDLTKPKPIFFWSVLKRSYVCWQGKIVNAHHIQSQQSHFSDLHFTESKKRSLCVNFCQSKTKKLNEWF